MRYWQSINPSSLLTLGLAVITILMSSSARAEADALLAKYYQINGQLEQNVYGIPIYLESNGDNGKIVGDVYGIIPHPFASIRDALGAPANWCEIVPQHLNIKACTYQYLDDQCSLSIYSGRKFYEKADDVYQIDYQYALKSRQDDYFKISLQADEGPLDTGDYNIKAEAIPLTESSTFIHFHYSYDYGFVTSLAMRGYFMTLGADKVGFSIVDHDENGKPVYVNGIRGVIERNSMRYYFAIQSYLDSLAAPADARFETRLNKWFELTEQHHAQLYEMDKADYLQFKRKEWQDQMRLQAMVNANSPPPENGAHPNGQCLRNGFDKS
ncbi:MAG: hypothetical protein PVF75_10685 [Granulosicoccaceae bacterium]|jgi:hypothetical protein